MQDQPDKEDRDKAEQQKRAEFLNREAAEVYLLLDYLSGRPDLSLGAPSQDSQSTGQQNTTQPPASVDADLRDPTRLVKRAVKIKYPLNENSTDFESDAAFIVLARDMLNKRASPANGGTIAFTSMVLRQRLSAPTNSFLADEAFPGLSEVAKKLANSISRIVACAAVLLAVALLLSGYLAWGKVLLDTSDAINRDFGAVQERIEKFEASRAHTSVPSMQGLPNSSSSASSPLTGSTASNESDDTARIIDRKIARICNDAALGDSCDDLEDLKQRKVQVSKNLNGWAWLFSSKVNDQWAAAALSVFGNYLLPIMYGLLGSMAFVLRRFQERLASRLLTPRDQQSNRIRLALGAVIGACIGLFFTSSAAASQQTGVLALAVSLSASALAFLAGYSVEAVFHTLDLLMSRIFNVSELEKPATQAAGRASPTT